MSEQFATTQARQTEIAAAAGIIQSFGVSVTDPAVRREVLDTNSSLMERMSSLLHHYEVSIPHQSIPSFRMFFIYFYNTNDVALPLTDAYHSLTSQQKSSLLSTSLFPLSNSISSLRMQLESCKQSVAADMTKYCSDTTTRLHSSITHLMAEEKKEKEVYKERYHKQVRAWL